MFENLQSRKPVTITEETMAKFKPTIDATSATLEGNTTTTWTGAASLAIFNSAVRDISALAVAKRTSHCMPPGPALHVLSHIPRRLHLAACRLIAEALPAIRNAAEDKEAANDAIVRVFNSFNKYVQPHLMVLHQLMQVEASQMEEIHDGRDSLLVDAAEDLKLHFQVFANLSHGLAPQSNPQSRMMAQEAAMHFAELESTLHRLD
jgi:hypothetical protein